MSAKKLGRILGLVFVVAAIVSGTGSVASAAIGEPVAQVSTQIIDWT